MRKHLVVASLSTLALLHSIDSPAQLSSASVVSSRVAVSPTGPGGGPTDIAVECPAGTAALSGGVDTNALSAFEVTALAPSFGGSPLLDQADGQRSAASGWRARVRNVSTSALQIALSTTCAPLPGVVVSIASIAVQAGDAARPTAGGVNAACPAGTVAVGGGVDSSRPATMKLSANAPIFGVQYLIDRPPGLGPPSTAWAGYVRNEGPPGTLRVAAICAPLTEVSSFSTGPFAIAPGSTAGFGVACPSGRIALGGGVDSHAVDRNAINVSTVLFTAEPQFPVNRAATAHEAGSAWYGIQTNGGTNATTAAVGVICAIPRAAPSDTDIVFEFYNTRLVHYFRTANAAEAAAIEAGAAGPGWMRTGDDFRAYRTSSPSGREVCRFYNPVANSHFYTASSSECDALKNPQSGWNYEAIAFRVIPPTTAGACPADMIPVYRLYNNRFAFNDSNHRFTTSFAAAAQLQDEGWIFEGVAFCAFP